MDANLARIKELLILKEATDAELESLIAGAPLKETKTRVCSNCNAEGHTARQCPQRQLPLNQ